MRSSFSSASYSPLPTGRHSPPPSSRGSAAGTPSIGSPSTWSEAWAPPAAAGGPYLRPPPNTLWTPRRIISLVLAGSCLLALALSSSAGNVQVQGSRAFENVRTTLECFNKAPPEPVVRQPFDRSLVLNFQEPQDSYKVQLKHEVRYVTTMSYGGHANQFISIYNLMFVGKILNRVVIIPTLIPLHFDADPVDMSLFFDIERFIDESAIPAIMLSDLKYLNMTHPPPQERISCWSVHERVTPGGGNGNDGSMRYHSIDVDYWAMPQMRMGVEGGSIWFNELTSFDSNRRAREDWIETVKKELIPQDREASRVASKEHNLKYGFDPRHSPVPDDQLLCFDTTLFIGSHPMPDAYPGVIPNEPRRSYEGDGWIHAGQFLHFTPEVETLADYYLTELFNVSSVAEVPPLITVHIRRSDFADAGRGYQTIAAYKDGVKRIRHKLQDRMDHPGMWRGPGSEKESFPAGFLADDYAVVVTTDEASDSPFVADLKALGWMVLDHDAMQTIEYLGEWYPTILDQAILARGKGFLGTEWSTYSYLAGLRVRYWSGGVEDWTPSG